MQVKQNPKKDPIKIYKVIDKEFLVSQMCLTFQVIINKKAKVKNRLCKEHNKLTNKPGIKKSE